MFGIISAYLVAAAAASSECMSSFRSKSQGPGDFFFRSVLISLVFGADQKVDQLLFPALRLTHIHSRGFLHFLPVYYFVLWNSMATPLNGKVTVLSNWGYRSASH